MLAVLLVLGMVFLLFAFVVFFGAPYLPTLKSQQQTALELLDLKPGQTLIELGSGDGRMLAAAAKQGINTIGYELNPLLAAYSWLVTRKYKGRVSIVFGDFWTKKLPPAEGVYVFLLDKYMEKLDKKLTQQKAINFRLVSFAFEVPGKKHITEKNGLYLYKYNNKKA